MAVPDSSSISQSATVPGTAAAAPAGAADAAAKVSATVTMPATQRRPGTGWCGAGLAGLDTRRPCRWRRGQIRSAEIQPTLIRGRRTCKGRGAAPRAGGVQRTTSFGARTNASQIISGSCWLPCQPAKPQCGMGCLREAGFSFETAIHAYSVQDAYIYGLPLQEKTLRLEPP